MGEKRTAYRILVRKPQRKRTLGRCGWVDNIKMDLKRDRLGWCGLDLSGSRYRPVEGSREHGNEPSSSIMLGNSSVTAQLAASQEGLISMELAG
jgi:hypothetical protein